MLNYDIDDFQEQANKEYEAIQNFKHYLKLALDSSRDAHHLGDMSYLEEVFKSEMRSYALKNYTHLTYEPRELTREEALRRELKPRHKKEILERDKYRCTNCGSHKNLCIDHKTPISRGGDNSQDNLQTLCRKCNCSKGNKTMQEWQEWLEDK